MTFVTSNIDISVTLPASEISKIKEVITGDTPLFAQQVAAEMDAERVAEYINIDDLASAIDVSHIDIESVVQRCLDHQDIADAIDKDEIAQCFSTREIAEHVSPEDVANYLDTDEIVENVRSRIRDDFVQEAADSIKPEEIVQYLSVKNIAMHVCTQFVHNEEFRKAVVDALIQRLASTAPQAT